MKNLKSAIKAATEFMKEEDVRRALCYDRRHKQLRVDGRDPVPDRLGDTVVSLLGLQPVRFALCFSSLFLLRVHKLYNS